MWRSVAPPGQRIEACPIGGAMTTTTITRIPRDARERSEEDEEPLAALEVTRRAGQALR
jgi:hypothetical protein